MKKTAAALALFFFLWQCSSPNYNAMIKEAEVTYYDGKNPKLASQKLIPHVNEDNEDQLLFMAEAGMLLHAAGEYRTSTDILLSAEKKADNLEKSITGEAASYFTNETGKPYRGEDYERINVNLINGLNFMAMNDYSSAMVEFRKVSYRIDAVKKKTKRLVFVNLMAKYLAAVTAAYSDEKDFGYVELKQIREIKAGLPPVESRLLNMALSLGYQDDYRDWSRKNGVKLPFSSPAEQKKFADVILSAEIGRAPIKVSRGRLLEEPGMQVALRAAIDIAIITSSASGVTVAASMAMLAGAEHPIPKYSTRKYSTRSARLLLTDEKGNQAGLQSTLLNNVEETMASSFEEQYESLKSKMIQRIAVKVVAALVAQMAAERAAKEMKASGGAAMLIGLAAGVAVGAVAFSAEKPDLRCWHTLPATFQAAEAQLPPGKYRAAIEYLDGSGNVLFSEPETEMILEAGKPALVLARSTD